MRIRFNTGVFIKNTPAKQTEELISEISTVGKRRDPIFSYKNTDTKGEADTTRVPTVKRSELVSGENPRYCER